MKTFLKFAGIYGFIIAIIVGCNKQDDKNGLQPIQGIEEITVASSVDGVVLSWKNPTERDYDEVSIWYTEEDEKIEISQKVEESFGEVDIALEKDKVYKFYLQVKSKGERLAEVQTIKGRKLDVVLPEKELETLLNSIEIYGGDGGFRILWDNPSQIEAIIKLDFEGEEVEINANNLTKEYTVPDLEEGKSYAVQMQIIYAGRLTDIKKSVSVIAKTRFAKLKNEGWEITASSEEVEAENGAAIHLLDDNPETYWRSKVSSPEESYPHYVIIDLQRERKIYGITLSRKKGDDDFSSWDNDISVSKDGINYTDKYSYLKNPANDNPIFKIEFNRTIEGEQMYLLPHVHTARYIKIDMLRASKNYAVFGDVNIYGE